MFARYPLLQRLKPDEMFEVVPITGNSHVFLPSLSFPTLGQLLDKVATLFASVVTFVSGSLFP